MLRSAMSCAWRAAFAASLAATAYPAAAQMALPRPELHLVGQEPYSANGKNWMRYRYDVANKDSFPDEMFAAAPHLPPCGTNTNSSRTWVDFYDAQGKRLYGFCALHAAEDLGAIWFSLEQGAVPPSWIYIELHDRQANRSYRSNLAATTP